MPHLAAVEQLIADAIRGGSFSGLAGEGQPLDLRRGELAGAAWLGHHLLENERLLPPWLQLGRDIEDQLSTLRRLDARHAALAAQLRGTGSEAVRSRLSGLRTRIENLGRRIRRQQDQFNIDAPGRLSERPGLWVEHLLERLDARLLARVEPGAASR